MKLRLIILIILTAIINTGFAQSSPGGIDGKVTDEKGEPVPFASVGAFEGGALKGQTKTDINGNYKIKPLDAGSYTVKFSSVGFPALEIEGIQVNSGRMTKYDAVMSRKKNITKVLRVVGKKLIDPGQPNGQSKSKEEITKLASVDVVDAIGTIAGVNKQSNGSLNLSGDRNDGTMYLVDGMMMRGNAISNMAPGAIRNVEVFRSGLPAKLGNATGGVVEVNTAGITSTTQGNIQAQTSVDGYFNNLVAMNLSGPLMFKKDSAGKKIRPLLGYVLSLSGRYNKDANPAYGGYRVLKPEVLEAIRANPITSNPIGTGAASFVPTAETITESDFRTIKARENGENYNINYLGKLDYSPTARMNLTLGTYFNYNRSLGWSFANAMFAPEANSINNNYQARGFVRMRQSLGKPAGDNKDAIFSNAFYTLQMSYQRSYGRSENPDHDRDVFRYGYVGKFNQITTPIYIQDTVSGRNGNIYQGWRFIGDGFSDLEYTPGGINPLLENYTNQIMNDPRFNIRNQTQMIALRGLRNGDGPASSYGLFTGPGAQIGSFGYSQSDQFNLNLDASFDINQGIRNKENKDPITHQVEFGLGYEQITSRSYSLAASSLWTQMRLLANRHIQTLDVDNPIFVVGGNEYTEEQLIQSGLQFSVFDTIKFNRFFAEADQSRFDKELRKKLFGNERNTTQVFTDNLDPSTFSLDMFSADDLYNQGLGSRVGYSGYDYLGNIQRRQPNFRDFWTQKDDRGDYLRPIAAYNPNYMYGYISDNFRYKDIQFNVGVRIDRFDANQSVLRDPYSLYGIRNLGSLNQGDYRVAINATEGTTAPDPKVAGFDETWMPYVDNNQSARPTLVGYRKGDTWYDPFGKEISDPTILSEEYANGLPIQPWLTDPTDSLKSESYKIDNAFTDYKPDITISPRIQFTFPITDQSLFYGNYDIVTQYPQGNNFVTPDDYYFLPERRNIINNANLQMQRSINYTLGFEQALTKRSKVGVEVYYRERKDQIQLQQYILAYPQTYTSYGNRDFSTTKGFTFTYKMLRSKNSPLRLSAAYTLQFAEGTGSSTTSMQSLIASGQPNLRTVFPMSFDARHIGNVNIDYRYPMGYSKGPKIGNHNVFSGLGANLLFNLRSGQPYTRTDLATPLTGGGSNVPIIGTLNGSRRPWTNDIGLRIDKDFILTTFGKKRNAEGGFVKNSGKPLIMNAYMYFQNLLNTRNVLSVYSYTGLADDDGYLSSPQGIQDINTSRIFPQAFIDQYNVNMTNPFLLDNPRRIYVGFSMNF